VDGSLLGLMFGNHHVALAMFTSRNIDNLPETSLKQLWS